jgi:hypothetical protein
MAFAGGVGARFWLSVLPLLTATLVTTALMMMALQRQEIWF